MSTKHMVLDSKGQVHKRTSANRVYSHAVVTHWKTIPAKGEYGPWPAHSKAEWSGKLELAQKVASAKRHEFIESVEIIAAVRM